MKRVMLRGDGRGVVVVRLAVRMRRLGGGDVVVVERENAEVTDSRDCEHDDQEARHA